MGAYPQVPLHCEIHLGLLANLCGTLVDSFSLGFMVRHIGAKTSAAWSDIQMRQSGAVSAQKRKPSGRGAFASVSGQTREISIRDSQDGFAGFTQSKVVPKLQILKAEVAGTGGFPSHSSV